MGNKQCKQNEITPEFVKKFVECGESFLDDSCGPLSCLQPLHQVFSDAKDAINANQAPLHGHLDPDTTDEINIAGSDSVDEAINAMISVANNMNEEGIGFFTFPTGMSAAQNADSSALALITTFLVTSQGNYTDAAASINRTNLPQLYGNYTGVGVDAQVKIALDINEVMKTILFPSTVGSVDSDEFLFVSTLEEDNKLMRGTLINILTGCAITADDCGPIIIPPGLYIKPPEKKRCKTKCGGNLQQNMWSSTSNGGAFWSSSSSDCKCNKHEEVLQNNCDPVVIGPKSEPYLLPFSLAGFNLFNDKAKQNPRNDLVSRFR